MNATKTKSIRFLVCDPGIICSCGTLVLCSFRKYLVPHPEIYLERLWKELRNQETKEIDGKVDQIGNC